MLLLQTFLLMTHFEFKYLKRCYSDIHFLFVFGFMVSRCCYCSFKCKIAGISPDIFHNKTTSFFYLKTSHVCVPLNCFPMRHAASPLTHLHLACIVFISVSCGLCMFERDQGHVWAHSGQDREEVFALAEFMQNLPRWHLPAASEPNCHEAIRKKTNVLFRFSSASSALSPADCTTTTTAAACLFISHAAA